MSSVVQRSANPQLYRTLAIGSDISRLSSGANVLIQAGYTVDIVLTVDRAVGRALARRYHIAVVSSTISNDEQKTIRTKLKRVRPDLPVLLLGPEHDSPDTFLSAIARCMKHRKLFKFGTRVDDLPLRHKIS